MFNYTLFFCNLGLQTLERENIQHTGMAVSAILLGYSHESSNNWYRIRGVISWISGRHEIFFHPLFPYSHQLPLLFSNLAPIILIHRQKTCNETKLNDSVLFHKTIDKNTENRCHWKWTEKDNYDIICLVYWRINEASMIIILQWSKLLFPK